MDYQEPKRVRRECYKGTHPKSFKEKYKELQPEQYAEDVAKVLQQGRTPAGTHRSIQRRDFGSTANYSRVKLVSMPHWVMADIV